jgi:hypothetical protein
LTDGLSKSDQSVEPASPVSAECASAPKVTMLVPAEVLAVVALLHAVPEAAVQV